MREPQVHERSQPPCLSLHDPTRTAARTRSSSRVSPRPSWFRTTSCSISDRNMCRGSARKGPNILILASSSELERIIGLASGPMIRQTK